MVAGWKELGREERNPSCVSFGGDGIVEFELGKVGKVDGRGVLDCFQTAGGVEMACGFAVRRTIDGKRMVSFDGDNHIRPKVYVVVGDTDVSLPVFLGLRAVTR